MIITSGKLRVTENKAKNKFFKDIKVGDVIEVVVDLNRKLSYNSGSRIITVKNHTQETERTDAPTYLNIGFEKMKWENIGEQEAFKQGFDEGYQEGYEKALEDNSLGENR